jgi:hypothetical protein
MWMQLFLVEFQGMFSTGGTVNYSYNKKLKTGSNVNVDTPARLVVLQ